METATETVNQTLETLASLPRMTTTQRCSPPLSAEPLKANRPAETNWQRNVLRLEIYHPMIQTLASAVEKLASKWIRRSQDACLLVVSGDPGCGKTLCARRLHQWALKMRPYDLVGVSFHRWPEICDGFKRGEYGVVNDMLTDSLLIIDDLGAEHDPSKVGMDKMCQILSRRERKCTMITTNIQPVAWRERFDARVEDRLFRKSVIVDLFGVESYSMR